MANNKKMKDEQQKQKIMKKVNSCPRMSSFKVDEKIVDFKIEINIEKNNKDKPIGQVIHELKFEELLRMSILVEEGFREERIKVGKKGRIGKYAEQVLQLYSAPETKDIAQDMADWITEEIVKTNKKNANTKRAKVLYNNLMNDL